MKRRAVIGMLALLAMAGLAPPSGAEEGPCLAWESYKIYLPNFFEVTGRHRSNLVRNFNAAPPWTDHRPDLVGYDWAPGSKAARLVFVEDGCVSLRHSTTLPILWAIMRSYPLKIPELDKDGPG